MKKALLVLLLIAGVPSFASIIYVAGSDDSLYTINPQTGALTRIGSSGAFGRDMYDLAESPGGILYAVSAASNLYRINTTTGAATNVGSDGDFVNALVFDTAGTLYGAGQNQFFKLNTSTGAATQVGPNGSFDSSGDLEFAGGTLYLTSTTGSTSTDRLYTVNPNTGVATALPNNIGFPNVYGLVYDGTTMYGFSDGNGSNPVNRVITINLTTGVGTALSTFTSANGFQILGAADPEVAPEPGSVALMGLGIALLAGGAYRRRRGLKQKSA